MVDEIGEFVVDPKVSDKIDQTGDQVGGVFQACSFQDIIGQWVSRIATSLKQIDGSIASLVEIWGKDRLVQEPVTPDPDADNPDRAMLNGRQFKGDGASQDDIDKLFD